MPAPLALRLATGLAAVVVTLVMVPPERASAQVAVQVVDDRGRPIPSVRIDLLGTGEVLSVDSTDADGVARLAHEPWSEVRRLTLSHLGFRTLIVQQEDVTDGAVLYLEPEATEIEGLTVEGAELCPIVPDPAARALWSEVASRYSPDTPHRAWFGHMARFAGSAREGELHLTSDVASVDYLSAGGPGTIHGGDHTPRPLEERVSKEGYAWPPLVIGGTSGSRSLAWLYPKLELEHAHHFASPTFGTIHDFALARGSTEEATLVFCPGSEATGATIRGTIRLIPGQAFLAADWRFENEGPDEGAGGAVTFASYVESPGRPPHLVSAAGYFYRFRSLARPYPELPRSYARMGARNVRWMLHATGERPCNTGISYFLDPPRSPEGERFHECVARLWARE